MRSKFYFPWVSSQAVSSGIQTAPTGAPEDARAHWSPGQDAGAPGLGGAGGQGGKGVPPLCSHRQDPRAPTPSRAGGPSSVGLRFLICTRELSGCSWSQAHGHREAAALTPHRGLQTPPRVCLRWPQPLHGALPAHSRCSSNVCCRNMSLPGAHREGRGSHSPRGLWGLPLSFGGM